MLYTWEKLITCAQRSQKTKKRHNLIIDLDIDITSTSTTAMATLLSSFTVPPSSWAGNAWFCVGPVSSYHNVDESGSAVLAELRRSTCGQGDVLSTKERAVGCRVFHVPRDDSSKATEIALDDADVDGNKDLPLRGLQDQVLVFRYKGKIHAVDHVSQWVKRLLAS